MNFSFFRWMFLFCFAIAGFADQGINCPQSPCDCFYQGDPLKGCECKPAYNFPAAIAVSNKWCGNFNLFIDASFIYWHADEEGLELARNFVVSTSAGTLGEFVVPFNRVFLSQSFDYKPGFKIGAGLIGNNQWMIYSEYTWIRDRMAQTNIAPPASTIPASTFPTSTGVWSLNSWYGLATPSGAFVSATSVSSVWKLHMDLLDLNLSRPFYQGRNLTLAPFGGLAAAWIRQSMLVEIDVISEAVPPGSLRPQPTPSITRSNCWGVGPKAGCNGYCLFPMGFRLQGNAAASILYTRYTKITHKESVPSTFSLPGPFKASLTDYNCLRPIAELGLGIGWGSYLACQKYHLDFSASYDFLIFWQQNMMRRLLDLNNSTLGNAPLDLHLHGLTATGRFDF